MGTLPHCHARRLHGSSQCPSLLSFPIVFFIPPVPTTCALTSIDPTRGWAQWSTMAVLHGHLRQRERSQPGEGEPLLPQQLCPCFPGSAGTRVGRTHVRTRAGRAGPRRRGKMRACPAPRGRFPPVPPAPPLPPRVAGWADPPRPRPPQRWRRSPSVCPPSRWPPALPRPGAPSGWCPPLGARPAAKWCGPGVPRAGGAARGSPGAVVRGGRRSRGALGSGRAGSRGAKMAARRGGAVPAANGAGAGGAAAAAAPRGLASGGALRESAFRAGSPLQVRDGGARRAAP